MEFNEKAVAAYTNSIKTPEQRGKEDFTRAVEHGLTRQGFKASNRNHTTISIVDYEHIDNPPADYDYGIYSHANAEAIVRWSYEGHEYKSIVTGWENAGWHLEFDTVIIIETKEHGKFIVKEMPANTLAQIGQAIVTENKF